MFKKTRVMVTISLLILFAIICFPLYRYHQTQQEIEAEINRTIHSTAVHAEIEGFLLKEDKQALTSKGKIQSYEIDYSSARPNPMGGIMFTVYINGDREIYLKFALSKHTNREDSSQSSEDRFGYSVSYPEKFRQLVGE